MDESDDLVISDASIDDAGELLTLQRAAYVSEAQLYGTAELPPLTQTLEELRAEFAVATVLKAVAGTRIVGAVRGHRDGSTLRIGRLIVVPDRQGQGIGTRLMAAIEDRFASAVDRFELFTGDRSEANLRLYARLGYEEVRREPLGERVVTVVLAKRGRGTRRSAEAGGAPEDEG